MSYLSQEALEEGKNFLQEKGNTKFNIKRLELIDQRINHITLRNILARTVAYEELLNFRNHAYHESFLKYYMRLNSSPLYLTEILGLHRALIQMEPGQRLPVAQLENHEGEITNSDDAFAGNSLRHSLHVFRDFVGHFLWPQYFLGICCDWCGVMVRHGADSSWSNLEFEKQRVY